VQQALPLDFVGTVAYVGSEGAHLLTLSEVNVVDPETGTRPYPTFGQVSWRGNISNSNYQALSVSLKRTFSRGLLLSANYQWSHEIDDGPTVVATVTPWWRKMLAANRVSAPVGSGMCAMCSMRTPYISFPSVQGNET